MTVATVNQERVMLIAVNQRTMIQKIMIAKTAKAKMTMIARKAKNATA